MDERKVGREVDYQLSPLLLVAQPHRFGLCWVVSID